MLRLIRISLLPHNKIPNMFSQVKSQSQSVTTAVRVTTGQMVKPPAGVGVFPTPRGRILRMEGRWHLREKRREGWAWGEEHRMKEVGRRPIQQQQWETGFKWRTKMKPKQSTGERCWKWEWKEKDQMSLKSNSISPKYGMLLLLWKLSIAEKDKFGFFQKWQAHSKINTLVVFQDNKSKSGWF